MNNFILGFFYPFKCIKFFFRHPKLILYSIVPMMINIIIYGTIFFYTYSWLTGKASDFIQPLDPNSFLYLFVQSFISIITFLLVLLVCYFAFVIFGGIITAPFNEKISKFVEENLFLIKVESNLSFWEDAWMSIKAELKKILFYLTIMIPLILIDFLPMIGSIITFVFGSLFSFFYNALDYMDYPLTRRQAGFRKKLKVVGSKKDLSMGFGCISFLLTFIPVINILLNPLLVVSGTSFFYEKEYHLENI